jgi:hypothetical protein
MLAGVFVLAGCSSDQTPASAARTAAAARAAATTVTNAAGVPPSLSAATTPVPRSVAVLIAGPNPVPAGDDPLGTTTITWSTGEPIDGEVYVSPDGRQEQLFATGSDGTADAPWIRDRSTYEFRLYRGREHRDRLAVLQVTRGTPAIQLATEGDTGPALTAEPNPVPVSGTELGASMISWNVDDPAGAELYVSTDGGPERLFAAGNSGSQVARWICPDSTYVFHLYAGADRKTEVKALTVTPSTANASQPVATPAKCGKGAP